MSNNADSPKDTLTNSQTPFYIVYEPVHALGLTANEFLTYCGLLYFTNRKTSIAFPSYNALADKLPISAKSVQRAIPGLVKKGLISVEQQYDPETKRYSSNHYTILPVTVGGLDSVTKGMDTQSIGVGTESPRNKKNIEQEESNNSEPSKPPHNQAWELASVLAQHHLGREPNRTEVSAWIGRKSSGVAALLAQAYPDIEAVVFQQFLEDNYATRRKQFSDATRLKAFDTINRDLGIWLAQRNGSRTPTLEELEQSPDWTRYHRAYVEVFAVPTDNLRRVAEMDIGAVRANLRSRLGNPMDAARIGEILSSDEQQEIMA